MGIDYSGIQARAADMIERYGAPAKLRRSSGDRDCTAAMVGFSPRRDSSGVVSHTDRKFLVAATGLSVPPDKEEDSLVILDPATLAEVEVLRIVEPPGKLAPGGVVVFWRLQCQ